MAVGDNNVLKINKDNGENATINIIFLLFILCKEVK